VSTQCRIELLGWLRATCGERTVTRFRSRQTAQLLAYLALHPHRTHPREVLIELLWPEFDLDAGRHSLSVALSSLRQQLHSNGDGDPIVVADRFSVGLNAAVITTDVAEFEAAIRRAARADSSEERARSLGEAVDLYTGELLAGYYEDWILAEQQRLDELYFQALRQLTAHLEQAGDMPTALQYALRTVRANRFREEAHREVMRLYAAAGQPEAALRQYRELERLLQEELEARPGPETEAILREIRQRPVVSRQPSVGSSRSAAASTQANAQAPAPEHLNPRTPEHPHPHTSTPPYVPAPGSLEPVGGAVPLGSRFYVVRETDREFEASLDRRDSIVLVKGARQVGKTSLLGRGLQKARAAGAPVVLTHFQLFNAAHLESADALLLAIAESIAEQLDLESAPARLWDAGRGPNPNFRRFMRREVLGRLSGPLVWGLDEVDRLFERPFSSEIFGMFRSWHDERVLEPSGPWSRLTLAIAYSTEVHLFIANQNQSPFNVGTRLELRDFIREQVADLNGRYGGPLREEGEIDHFYSLLGGQPYLVRQGLHEMAAHGASISVVEERACSEDWVFGPHLRRILSLVTGDPHLCEGMRAALHGEGCPSQDAFFRLRAAGILTGASADRARPRCRLYELYLRERLP
jgi:DNA-binding SARP family transcriptional activator